MRAARTAGTKRRGDRHAECDGGHQPDRRQRERRRTRAAEEAGARIGEQWSGQPADREPGRRGEQGHDDVFGEQHGGDQAGCAADGLEQSDAPDLLGHPASDEHGDAGHGEQAEQPAAGQQGSPLVSHHVGARIADPLPGLQHRAVRTGGARERGVLVDEGRGCGRVGQLQVQDVGQRLRLWREAPRIRLREPHQAGRLAQAAQAGQLRIRRRGGGDRDAGDLEPPALQRDRIAGANAERVGEGGLDHHAAVSDPAALGEPRLVDRGPCGVAPLGLHGNGAPVGPQGGPDDRVRSAVADDARSLGQRLQPGAIGGPVAEHGRLAGPAADHGRHDAGHHVGPGRRLPRALIGLADHAVQDEPERQRARGRRDGQQQECGFDRPPAQVAHGEAPREHDPAHPLSPPVRQARRAVRSRGSVGSPRRRCRRASRSAGRRWPRSARRG